MKHLYRANFLNSFLLDSYRPFFLSLSLAYLFSSLLSLLDIQYFGDTFLQALTGAHKKANPPKFYGFVSRQKMQPERKGVIFSAHQIFFPYFFAVLLRRSYSEGKIIEFLAETVPFLCRNAQTSLPVYEKVLPRSPDIGHRARTK